MFRWPPFGPSAPPISRAHVKAPPSSIPPGGKTFSPSTVLQLVDDTLQLDKAGLREDNALSEALIALGLRRNIELAAINAMLHTLCERLDNVTLALRDRS